MPFFYVEEEYRIQDIETSLTVIYPGSKALLQANLLVPEIADPYIRWIQDKSVLTGGLLSDGTDQIYWLAPEEEGVYTLTVEIFPVPPPPSMEFSLNSSIVMNTELYVSSNVKSDNDLSPRQSYFSLLHLNGSLLDTGEIAGDSQKGLDDAQEIGILEPVAREGNLGYRITNSSGFLLPRFLLPVDDGVLQPFSISLGITLESLDAGARLVRTASGDGFFVLTVFLDDTYRPSVLIQTDSQQIQVPSAADALLTDRRYLLTLSIEPSHDERGFELIWHIDGREKKRLTLDVPLGEIADRGETVFGGSGGFNGFLDEIGVYFRDPEGNPSIDTGLFHTAMAQEYGIKLIYADGFEADGFAEEGVVAADGDMEIGDGVLVLAPAAELLIPSKAGSSLTVELGSEERIRVNREIRQDKLNLLLTVVGEDAEYDHLLDVLSGSIAADGFSLSVPGGEWKIPSSHGGREEPAETSGVETIRIINGKNTPLSIDSVLLTAK